MLNGPKRNANWRLQSGTAKGNPNQGPQDGTTIGTSIVNPNQGPQLVTLNGNPKGHPNQGPHLGAPSWVHN